LFFKPLGLKAWPIAFFRFNGVIPFTLNLDEFLLAAPPGVDGLDWLVESDKGVFNDFASRLAVDRFDRGVTLRVLTDPASIEVESTEVLLSILLFRPGVGGPGFM